VNLQVPEGARVWVDNVYCPVRSFQTPALQTGKKYFYTVRAEIARNGRTIVEDRRVVLTAGQAVNVNFAEEPQTVQR
jgi:uncharacterized protein (TIGR03000 family)